MMRHDYGTAYRLLTRGDVTAALRTGRVRTAAAAFGAAMLFAVALWSWEAQRIGQLDAAIAGVRQRSVAVAREAERARRMMAIVERERLIGDQIALAHRSALASTNAVAQVGNALPEQTWLTTLTAAPSGGWLISGRSTRVAEIGLTLHAIAALEKTSTAHLQTVAATGRDGRILDFVIGWDRQT